MSRATFLFLTLPAALWLAAGCSNTQTPTPRPTPPQAITQPTAAKQEILQSDTVKKLVEQLVESPVVALKKPTPEQAEELARAMFAAVRDHDMTAGLALSLNADQVREMYKPSVANIMAPGLRFACEKKLRDLQRYLFERTVHLDRIVVGELMLLGRKTSLSKPTYQFPHVHIHLLADDMPVTLVLGQVMELDGRLLYMTLEVRQP